MSDFTPQNESHSEKVTVGWREWVRVPDLGLPDMRAKIDTGAKTSAIHAFEVTPFEKDGEKWVRFRIRPRKSSPELEQTCEAKVIDQRIVKSSTGEKENRYVISQKLCMGPWHWETEMTLTDRDTMAFLMLIGRRALAGRFLVDSAASFLLGRPQVDEAEPIESSEPVYIGK